METRLFEYNFISFYCVSSRLNEFQNSTFEFYRNKIFLGMFKGYQRKNFTDSNRLLI
jgi:hypothetical protein